jgi:hypothetical protein
MTAETLFAVIPGRDEVASYDVQLHIGESMIPGCGYGFRVCALRRIPERRNN